MFAILSTSAADGHHINRTYLFDTSISATHTPSSPQSSTEASQPPGLEPCPESSLLRSFWLMRAVSSSITHTHSGFVTTRLFVPHDVWLTRGVNLRSLNEKVANIDLLTAALGRIAGVDTYDADARMEVRGLLGGDGVSMVLLSRVLLSYGSSIPLGLDTSRRLTLVSTKPSYRTGNPLSK
jgi:hypothetical protein